MSDMVKRYEESNSPRVVEARQIPGLAVNMVDQLNFFQDEFSLNRKPKDPTDFTQNALTYYKDELKGIVTPEGFIPSEQGVGLNRWTPDNKYYSPGSPSSK
jgi:hypothetical protein